ncbi:hypothetical protein [Cognatiyoonia sp. IB215182]|uniref:hypothetical protein n=1 Tax=Cognatiyoonia sp. IB215182 TaxID=3097353 RepID=UPI002A0F4718|nr:hypothetical protein [Cognatiyoonia sp. IB215182]MDX8352936.1 hypothetical protein [Cognatiyoonia sp. IB215182]
MIHNLTKAVVALGACLATPATAEGYNTFVITIPYEISLPSEYVSVEVECWYQFDATDASGQIIEDGNVAVEIIDLTQGQASGTLKFGYDVLGQEQGLLDLGDREQILRETVAYPDFDVELSCSHRKARTATDTLWLFESGGVYSLRSNRNHVLHLDNHPNAPAFTTNFKMADNQFQRGVEGTLAVPNTLTVPNTVPSQSDGLNSLRTILDGQ